MLALLRQNPAFRLFWAGQTVSMFGNYTLPVALALFAALRFHSADAVGLVLGARALGSVVMLLIGGALADAWDRKRLMLTADLLRAILVVVLATGPSLAATVVVCLLLGGGEGLFYPAYNAFVVEVVPPEHRKVANSLNSVGTRGAAVAAPACAALTVSFSGTTALFVVDAVTFAVSLVTLLPVVRSVARTSTPGAIGLRSVAASIADGLREVRRRRWVALMIGQDAINSGFAYAPVSVLLPLLLLSRGYAASTFGIIAACSAFGSVVGGFLGAKVTTDRPGVWALCLTAPFSLYAVAIALPSPPPLLMILAALSAIGQEIGLILWYTGLQCDVPEAALSRVNSVDWMGSMSLQPIGQALTGTVAGLLGATPLLLGAGVIFAASTLTPLLSREVREFRTRVPEVEVVS